MSPDNFDGISRAIGRLEGTVTQQHEATRASINKLFDKTNELEEKVATITSGGCELGKKVVARLDTAEKKLGLVMLVLASLIGIGKVAELLIK